MAYPGGYPPYRYAQPPNYQAYGGPPPGYIPPSSYSGPTAAPGEYPPYGYAQPPGYPPYGTPGGHASPSPYAVPTGAPGGYLPYVSPPVGDGAPPPGSPSAGFGASHTIIEGKPGKAKKEGKAKKTKNAKKSKGGVSSFTQPGYAPSAGGGGKAWHVVSSPQQFSWSFNGEQYPESKETGSDCAWTPQKPGYQTDLVTCQDIGKLSVWDAASGQAIHTLLAPGCQYPAGIMSGGIEILAASGVPSSSTTVHLFNMNTGATIHRFEKLAGLSCALQSISFLPSSGPADLRLAAVGDQPDLRIFDMGTGLQALSIPLTVGSGQG